MDYIQKYEEYNKREKNLNTKIIQLNAAKNNETENFKNLVKEVRDLGVDPTNLANTITEMENDIQKKLEEREADLIKGEKAVKDIEDALNTLKGN